MSKKNIHRGSDFRDFLNEQGILGEVESRALKQALSLQLDSLLKKQELTKTQMASRMKTSRAAVDRLLDASNSSVTLNTLGKAARALGRKIKIELVPGDTNYDGIVDQNELNAVLAAYWPSSPWLYMTNVAGLGGTNVTFALTNATAGAFSVQSSTDLVNWYYLGPATPRYLFNDTNAPSLPQRYYRLTYP